MKIYSLLLTMCMLIGCTSNSTDGKIGSNNIDSKGTTQFENNSLDKQPVKTIMDFLKWYKDHMSIQNGLVNDVSEVISDTTTFYSVNFEATEKYLSSLKATGFISDLYVKTWRTYFEKCSNDLHENPANDGPPRGFEYDFVLHTQEYDESLSHLEQSKVVYQSVNANRAKVIISFPNGDELTYKLTKSLNNWEIDDISVE